MFSSACGRIDVSILKLSQEFENESLTKKKSSRLVIKSHFRWVPHK